MLIVIHEYRQLQEELSRHFPEATEENNENPS
jgi:hypothetical protein